MSDFFGEFDSAPLGRQMDLPAKPPLKLSVRTLGRAIEEAMMGGYTRVELETVLADELRLDWPNDDLPSDAGYSKRSLIQAYMPGWTIPQLAALARRIVTELDLDDHYLSELTELLATYDAGGGVAGSTKNLIFAANGPKPEIVLRDAMNNDIEIVANAEYCLVYEDSIPAEGLRFSHLVTWWREREQITATTTDREVGLALHERLAACLDSLAERVVFDAYAGRYRASFDIPVLIPQVYLHYDPYDQRTRRASRAGAPPGPAADGLFAVVQRPPSRGHRGRRQAALRDRRYCQPPTVRPHGGRGPPFASGWVRGLPVRRGGTVQRHKQDHGQGVLRTARRPYGIAPQGGFRTPYRAVGHALGSGVRAAASRPS